MAKTAQSNVERYRQLVREVSKQLGVKADDPRVPHVASLHLGRESLMAQMIAGQEDVDPTALLKFDEAIRSYMPVSKPIQISLTPLVRCPECGCALIKNAPAIADPVAIEPAVGVQEPIAPEPAPAPVKIDPSPMPAKAKAKPKPFHETHAKDTRPNAPASLNGSIVWFGGPGK
jgi:hypothetical protein